MPDANTIWTYRKALKRAGVVDTLFRRFDAALRVVGYMAMSGQIVDVPIIAAPKQRNTEPSGPRSRSDRSCRVGRRSRLGCARRIATRAGR